MTLFDVIFLPYYLVQVYPMMSTPQCFCSLSSNTLTQLRVMLFFCVIEMAIVNLSNITHGVFTLKREIQILHCLGYLEMDLSCFLLNRKNNF